MSTANVLDRLTVGACAAVSVVSSLLAMYVAVRGVLLLHAGATSNAFAVLVLAGLLLALGPAAAAWTCRSRSWAWGAIACAVAPPLICLT